MSHFKIFIPGATGNKPEHLENIGLGDLHSGCFMHRHNSGERAGDGMLVSWATPGTTLEFQSQDPDDIEWIKAVPDGIYKAERYWVLVDKTSLPTPTELERPYQNVGTTLELGDGKSWVLTYPDVLPSDMRLADDGSHIYTLQRKFHKFSNDCVAMRDRYIEAYESANEDDGEGEFELSFGDCADIVVESLLLNYRGTRELFFHIGLFNTGNTLKPFEAVIGGTKTMSAIAN